MGSTAAMNAAPASLAIWTACVPSPPMPHSPTRSPGRSAPRSSSAAYGVDTASQAMAPCSNDTWSGSAASAYHGTRANSAHAPS